MTKKLLYEQPDSELFVVRIEQNILSGESNSANNGYDDDNDLGEI